MVSLLRVLFVSLNVLLFALSGWPRSALAADPLLDTASGKLALSGLSVNAATYSINLTLIDAAAFKFKADMASLKAAAAGTSVQAVFSGSTGQLFIPRVQVGSVIYNVQLKLIDAASMTFQLVTAKVVSGDGSTSGGSGTSTGGASTLPPGQTTNDFSYIASEFVPSAGNSVSISIPSDGVNPASPAYAFSLPETDLTVMPVSGTSSDVIVSGQFVRDKTQSNCRFTFSFRVNLGAAQPVRIQTSGSADGLTSGKGMRMECNTQVNDGKRNWNFSTTGLVTGSADVALSIDADSATTGRATMTVQGTGTLPAMQMDGTSLLNSNVIQSGNASLTLKASVDIETRTDGSVYSNGVLVKAGSGSGGSSGNGSSGSCTSTFEVTSLTSYYSGSALSYPQRSLAAKSAVTTVEGGSGKAIILSSDLTIESVPRFRLQLMIPGSSFRTGTYEVRDDQNILGFDSTSGAIVRLIYSIGQSGGTEVNDSFWSNKDWGSQRARQGVSSGTINISSVSATQVKGTFSNLQLSGDGYPSLNNYFATLASGTFCANL